MESRVQTPKMRRIRRATQLADQVTERLRTAILRGDFKPGSRMRQEDLAAQLAVSRAPVREALLVLEREGLVQTDRLSGTVVAPLDAALIRDLYDFREAVERHVAEVAARRTDMSWSAVHEIVKTGLAATQAASPAVALLIDLDLRFHTALYEAAGNRILCDVMRSQWGNMQRVMAATLTVAGYPAQIWDEHAGILDAIMLHDAARAGAFAAAHTRSASLLLVERYSRADAQPQPAATVSAG